jgi:predicted RNA-binding Zn ribbon-like protein
MASSIHREALRACHALGCVLLFLKDHPRREWWCNACGNRARQARHYARRH